MRLYANPYAFDGQGFYFDSLEEYEKKYAAEYKRRRTEEYEIEFIDGEPNEVGLFKAFDVNQANLGEWFELVEWLEGQDSEADDAAAYYAMDVGGKTDVDEIKRLVEDEIRPFQGTMLDYAHSLLDDGIMPSNPQAYFDYEAFGEAAKNEYLTSVDYEEEGEDEIERVQNMSDREYGEELMDSMYGDDLSDVPAATLLEYFDFEMFARDLEMGGDMDEFEFAGKTWVVTPL